MLHGGYLGFPRGGLVPGLTRGFDHIPAMLDAGEFVVNSWATRQFRPLLEAINAGGTARPESRAAMPSRGTDGRLLHATLRQNTLLEEQNRLLRQIARRGGASAAVL
jgi:hypothetical protein